MEEEAEVKERELNEEKERVSMAANEMFGS